MLILCVLVIEGPPSDWLTDWWIQTNRQLDPLISRDKLVLFLAMTDLIPGDTITGSFDGGRGPALSESAGLSLKMEEPEHFSFTAGTPVG